MEVNREYFRISELMAAFSTGSQTEEDEKELQLWLQEDERNQRLWERLMNRETYEENNRLSGKFPANEAWAKIEASLDNDSKVRKMKPWRNIMKYAAILLGVLSVGTLYWWNQSTVKSPIAEQQIPAGSVGAKLTLGNGRVVDISKNNSLEITETDGTRIATDSGNIDYSMADMATGTPVLNEIQTMTGMEYSVTLSDGTRIFLNAETKLKFPVAFKGTDRTVELTGEAYFDVAKDAKHPFIIKNGNVAVKVLGTSFNFRAYADEQNVVTTLAEGKVAVSSGGEWRHIVPGEQAVVTVGSGKMEVRRVDVMFYTAWRTGRFVFRNEELGEVLKQLSRWYRFEYRFEDEGARSIEIGASFDRYNSMAPIIDMLGSTGLVKVKFVDKVLYISSVK
ncbi:FecR family protein [Chitinophaga niabensis]|uniref:Ferric-dicitrate binding protein FerR, regulates iron transport through sigma-19 n=1 Tax=Chitinophaga niabensis TaxID=536979 RepID=A0A1N6D4C6_9BACT|nr:FecR family protein [Chitinophaga niabensis]SIN65625.1 ferric-dicitrate binding protein FerR, regulates iron transport through sigma-19 [Chitinophaga niabensis]